MKSRLLLICIALAGLASAQIDLGDSKLLEQQVARDWFDKAHADDDGDSKLRKSIDKAIELVGSERVLRKMILEVNKVWDPILLKGYTEHANSGGSVYDFFINPKQDSSGYYLKVERHDTGYKLTIGYCVGGTCGEGADFEFTNSFGLIGNGPNSEWIH